jgi:hypothetical protein
MTEAGSGQAVDWIRKAAELFVASGVQKANGEFCRENQITFLMLTAPAQLQPDLQVLVHPLNESRADQPGGSSAHQTTREIMAEIVEEWDQMSTPEPDEHHLDGMSRIRAVIDSLPRISTSRNRYLEKDLEVMFHDRFLVHAIARNPHAARQIHEPTLRKWRCANADIVQMAVCQCRHCVNGEITSRWMRCGDRGTTWLTTVR